ncbi:MAG TPA: restriction endonuclease [Thermoguttaceae bacterium]
MAIPDFQSIMLPLLRHLADGTERSNLDTLNALAKEFALTEAEIAEMLPSGQQTRFRNRIAWAKAHFKAAGIIESPRRGVYRITERGREFLKLHPDKIDLKSLDKFPEHREFRTSSQKKDNSGLAASVETEMTPQEYIEYGYQQIRFELMGEILRLIKECPPEFFEGLVIDLLLAMGYGGSRLDAGKAIGRSGDGGIDGIIKEDRLGLDIIYIQAKRWEGVVGRPEIQKFVGALQGQRARKGIFITTSSFTKDARLYAEAIDSKIILIDGEELAGLMIDHNIGVNQVSSYTVKRIDSEYFIPE